MTTIRWGVLSTANIARTQLIPAIKQAGNAEIAAIASRGPKAHDAAAELKIPKAYETYEELLEDPEIDAVYIPLPNHLHKEWVFKAAERGKHILCEKPAALNAKDTEEMIHFCRERNVKFMEAFMYQFHPQHARVREIIKSGEIGEVKLMKSSHSFNFQNREGDIRMAKEMGGGSLYDVGCYSVHAIRTVLESEPAEVQARAEIDEVTGVDTSAYVFLELENGIPAIFDCSFDTANRNEYEVIGTEGTIKVPYAFRPDQNGGIGPVIVTTGNTSREEKIAGSIYQLEVEHFSAAILNDAAPVYSGESAVANMRVLDACFTSMATGKRISLRSDGAEVK
ncbi:Gfo/Idh/MocA family protein [Planococcus lenghuensis]|uniref:Oxidoreductase n=1 Tax=Planococcus lenghuensis TaxID=2213202 RepID=A0A1Q2L4L6_9BACL|nr:Gfo/Idh/MocA family oxidoreductase [Planococcus lenghuensis]AQQ54812.1 oxidoreductase [Planococcus lenghuensis]